MDLHFNSFADRIKYALRDFTSVGSKTSFNLPVLSDESLYKMNPDRYSFYMQLLDALQDPKSEVLDRILQVENKTRLARERMEERLSNVGRNLRYLQLRFRKKAKEQAGGAPLADIEASVNNARTALNSMENATDTEYIQNLKTSLEKQLGDIRALNIDDGQIKQIKDLIAELQTKESSNDGLQKAADGFNNAVVEFEATMKKMVDQLQQTIKSVEDTSTPSNADDTIERADSELERVVQDETNPLLTIFDRALVSSNNSGTGVRPNQPGGAGGIRGSEEGSFYQQKLDEISSIEKSKDNRDKNKALDDLVEEVDSHPIFSPKFESVSMTDRIIFIAMTFIIRGLSLFLIDWGLNSHMINSFNSAFLYYIIIYFCIFLVWILLVNAGEDGKNLFFRMLFYYVNWDAHGPGRILVHGLVQFMLLPVPFIVKDRVVGKSPTWTYEQRRATYRVLSNFTFFIWVLTSVIALRY